MVNHCNLLKITSSIILSFFIFLFVVRLESNQIYAATYAITPSHDLSDALSVLTAGDTLILGDGIYTEALIVNNSGTSESPITIRAENDGGAIIDGQDSLFNTVIVNGNYIVLEGITAREATNHIIVIDGSHVTARKVSGYNTNPAANAHIWVLGGEDIVVEEGVAAGAGRYMFLAYEANNVIFRRCFGYWLNNTTNSQPKNVFGIYGSSNVSIINSFGTHVIPPNDNSGEEWAGVYITKNTDPTQLDPVNPLIKGSIFTDIWRYGVYGNSSAASNMIIENNLIYNVKDLPCVYAGTCGINTAGIFTYLSPSGTIKNNSVVSNENGIWMQSTVHTLINNNFVSNDYAHRQTNNTNHSYTNLWNNTNTSTLTWTLNSTTTTLNPGYDTSTYGIGAYLFIPNTSPLKGAGASGDDIGANILYRYDDNGNLTSEPLWPWPQEDRIVEETTRELGFAVSPTWEEDGGMWKTLAGVYPSPEDPINLSQKKAINSSSIVSGGWINTDNVDFVASISSDLNPDTLNAEFEVRDVNTGFSSATQTDAAKQFVGSIINALLSLTNLSDGQYHWRVRTTNDYGSSSWISFGGNSDGQRDFGIDTVSPTTPGDPTTSTPTTDTTPTWTWTASTDTTSGLNSPAYTVEWSQTSNFLSGVSTSTATSNSFTHSIALTDGTWYFRVFATDAAGNLSANSNNGSVVIDSTSPGLSSLSVSPSNSGATINWISDENASSQVDYGLTSTYSDQSVEADISPRVTTHQVILSNLQPCTTYHYRVRGKDSINNEVINVDQTFATTGCVGNANVIDQNSSNITIASGGAINLLSGGLGLTLIIPSGFGSTDSNFQIKQLEMNSVINAVSTPTDFSLISSYLYDLSSLTDVTTKLSSFLQPLTVTIKYQSSDLAGKIESSLKIYRYDGGSWKELSGCIVDTSIKSVSCTTTQFSVFGLFGQSTSISDDQNSNTSSSSISSSSNESTSVSSGCSDLAPTGIVDLFQIDRKGSSATLYFTPASTNTSRYNVIFGFVVGEERYGGVGVKSQSLNQGVQSMKIDYLDAKKTYSFKIIPVNGCATGEWSNWLTARGGGSFAALKRYYRYSGIRK